MNQKMKQIRLETIELKKNDIHLNSTFKNDDINYLLNLKAQLNQTKNKLDNIFNMEDISMIQHAKRILKLFDPFVHYKYNIAKKYHINHINNAWLKCYEMLNYFKLIPNNSDKFIYFDNAAFPGGFSLATNYYLQNKTNIQNYKWYASSLINEQYALEDTYDLYKNHPENWLMNDINNGDITNLENIYNFAEQIQKKEKKVRSIDLYFCDIGFECNEDFNNQEKYHFHINMCQIFCGLNLLKSHGNMIIKHFTIFEPYTITYLSLLTLLFKDVYICKPISSKRTNSEIYIVCKDYKFPFLDNSIEMHIINIFIAIIKNKNFTPLVDSSKILKQIQHITQISQLIYQTQINTLTNFIISVNHIKDPVVSNHCYNELMKENKNIINQFNLCY